MISPHDILWWYCDCCLGKDINVEDQSKTEAYEEIQDIPVYLSLSYHEPCETGLVT